METIKAVMTRRSVRQFLKEKISDDVVEKLLRAAMSSPTAKNTQSWRFVVIDDERLLKKVATFHPHAKMAAEAPLGIVCCHDMSAEEIIEYGIQNVSAAIENMLIMARDMELGAVWIGLYPRKERVVEFRQMLALPEHILPISLVVFGHTDIKQAEVDRFDAEKIHYNGW